MQKSLSVPEGLFCTKKAAAYQNSRPPFLLYCGINGNSGDIYIVEYKYITEYSSFLDSCDSRTCDAFCEIFLKTYVKYKDRCY